VSALDTLSLSLISVPLPELSLQAGWNAATSDPITRNKNRFFMVSPLRVSGVARSFGSSSTAPAFFSNYMITSVIASHKRKEFK
jgi:hypothetical protein